MKMIKFNLLAYLLLISPASADVTSFSIAPSPLSRQVNFSNNRDNYTYTAWQLRAVSGDIVFSVDENGNVTKGKAFKSLNNASKKFYEGIFKELPKPCKP